VEDAACVDVCEDTHGVTLDIPGMWNMRSWVKYAVAMTDVSPLSMLPDVCQTVISRYSEL
jgi:hypothetical protein